MKNIIKVKTDVTKMPNPMHLNVQQTYRQTVIKPKKGKGSYDRRKLKDLRGE